MSVHAQPAQLPPSPANARAARRLVKLKRVVQVWWDSMPAETRPTHFLGAQIVQGVGMPTTLLGPALRALGWRRDQMRLGGRQVGVWVSPGAACIKRPVGRPSLSQLYTGR